VQHSWWVPALGGKFDAVPGYTNFTWFKARKVGTYSGQCAELCGRDHARMTARVQVLPPAQYQAWHERQKRAIAAADRAGAATQRARQQRERAANAQGVEAPASE
jgi:cytochrome c oxidase subunit 2